MLKRLTSEPKLWVQPLIPSIYLFSASVVLNVSAFQQYLSLKCAVVSSYCTHLGAVHQLIPHPMRMINWSKLVLLMNFELWLSQSF